MRTGALRLPSPCLVVLIGPSGAGKSTWAGERFAPHQIVSSDALRGLVGEGEHDQRAGTDAFAVLDDVLARRMRRRLTTVIDTLGLDADRRRAYLEAARRHAVPCIAVLFDTSPSICRARNRRRTPPVPAPVVTAQLRAMSGARDAIASEGFDLVVDGPGEGAVVLVPSAVLTHSLFSLTGDSPMPSLRFGLQIPSVTWPGGPAEIGPRLSAIASAAEDAGFESIWLMDHFRQIPQVGPEWHDMLDSYTTLGFLAASTSRVRLGTMVTGITYRNVAHLGKIVATLDVLSGGRAVCGIGAAWFEKEHRAYGWEFPPLSQRYALLEDALQLLPVLWGKGAPAFEGRVLRVPEAMCYPRPLQSHVPILVGGSGERKTLRLVAKYADACNVFGDASVVAHKVGVLRAHCEEVGRAIDDIEVTQLSTALVGRDDAEVAAIVEQRRPPRMSAERYSASVNAGTVADHIGRFRALAEAGVQTAVLSLADLGDTAPVERFAEVIRAFPSVPS